MSGTGDRYGAPAAVPGPGGAPRPGPPAGVSAGAAPDGGSGAPGVPAEVAALAASVAALDQLADLPVADHVTRYDALHGELSATLASVDGI